MAPPKLKGLGRGLDILLSGNPADEPVPTGGNLQTLLVAQLQPGKYQPRTRMDPGSLEELAGSIRSQGVMQPILVRPLADARFEIVAGERRWRASMIAGLEEVPVLVREIPDESALAMSLIENIQRENLNPLEEAAGLQRLVDEFKMTHQQAAEAVGRSRSAASNLLRLLQLTKPVQELLMAGDIDMGHARALLPLSGGQQVAAANRVVAKRMSVRDTESLVQSELNPGEAGGSKKGRGKVGATAVAEMSVPDRDLSSLEEEISDALCARVMIQSTPRGSGQVVIDYSSLDQLDGILDRLRGKMAAMMN